MSKIVMTRCDCGRKIPITKSSLFSLLFALLLGNISGLLLGPGYFGVVPGKDKTLGYINSTKEKVLPSSTYNSKEHSSQPKNSSQNRPTNSSSQTRINSNSRSLQQTRVNSSHSSSNTRSTPRTSRASNKRTQKSSENPTKYMGRWYFVLRKHVKSLEKVMQSNTSTEDPIKRSFLQTALKSTKNYPEEIYQDVKTLNQSMKAKSLRKWVASRKTSTSAVSQKEQAQVIERFFREKKFKVGVSRSLKRLEQVTTRLRKEAARGTLSKNSLGQALQVLSIIERKYDQEQQEFNSAVLNFQHWQQ